MESSSLIILNSYDNIINADTRGFLCQSLAINNEIIDILEFKTEK